MENIFGNDSEDKKMLFEKYLKLLPKEKISDLMQKIKSDLMKKFKSEISQMDVNPLMENEKEKDSEEGKILTQNIINNYSDRMVDRDVIVEENGTGNVEVEVENESGGEKLSPFNDNLNFDIEIQNQPPEKKEKKNFISRDSSEYMNLYEEEKVSFDKEDYSPKRKGDDVKNALERCKRGLLEIKGIKQEITKKNPIRNKNSKIFSITKDIKPKYKINTTISNNNNININNTINNNMDNNMLLRRKRRGRISAIMKQNIEENENLKEINDYNNYNTESNNLMGYNKEKQMNDFRIPKENSYINLVSKNTRNNYEDFTCLEDNYESKYGKIYEKEIVKEPEKEFIPSGENEKDMLLEYIKSDDGFLEIIKSLIKSSFNRNNVIEKQIEDMVNGMGLLKTSLFVFQVFFENFLKNQKNNSKILENSFKSYNFTQQNVPKANTYSIIESESEKDEDKSFSIENEDIKLSTDNEIRNIYAERNLIKLNQNENKTIKQNNENYNYSNNNYNNQPKTYQYFSNSDKNDNNNYNFSNQKKNASNFDSNDNFDENFINLEKEREKERERKREKEISFNLNEYLLSVHYHKDKTGRVYKFAKHHLIGKDIMVFYCCDRNCHATANYHLKDKSFVPNDEHNLKYEEHLYAQKVERSTIVEEMRKKKVHEAQVFKKIKGPKIIQWYD
jgi:hypothetical protein